jgi:quinol monooxygenase YgiN
MTYPNNVVSIHPYFKVFPGKLDQFKTLMLAFVAKTAEEPDNLYYEFSVHDDVVFCREGYRGASGALRHLENVGEQVTEALKIAELIRLEIHGPAAELQLMKEPLGPLSPTWFEIVAGVQKG